MLYSLEKGARGFTFPRHFTPKKGAKLTIAPRELAATVPVPQLSLEDYAKYGAAPLAALAVTVLMLQLAGSPTGPVAPHPHASPATNGSAAAQLTSVTTQSKTPSAGTDTGTNTAAASSTTSTTTASAPRLIDPVMTSPVVPITSTDPVGGLGGGTTTPVTPPVDTTPITGGTTDPGTGTIDPGTGSNDPDTGGTVTTPVAQVGVDVFSPSVSLGLAP